MTAFDIQAVTTTLDKMKMLFWRLDLSKRSFMNLNECSAGVLGLENYRFFKDRDYREKILFPDDRILMDRTMASIKERMPVRTVFRVQSENAISWFKLTGWPTADYRYYEGAVEEITEHVAWLKNIFNQQDKRLLSIDADYPVALFNDHTQKLLKANDAFCRLLEIDTKHGARYRLADFILGDIKLPQILETLFMERRLSLELVLATQNQGKARAFCQFEYFSHGGEGYIRLAVIDQTVQKPAVVEKKPLQKVEVSALCDDLSQCQSVEAMLERIYQERILFPDMDVVMFSDIYARKNKVIVYSRGEMDEPLEPGSQFPYAGTIAENIEKEKLEYLIVDDTQSSIKAIDWMLFVPKGLYSYVAKALYVRGAMRTVLILCSRKKHAFSEDDIADVTAIATAFHQQLKKIRRIKT
ncbi:MAG: hypothetical protein JXQ81_13120 [Desulfuromonadales bacterium]|nr:hypothetical protein [Desulfuromonadales bacterium]MBN2793445.1 hypothetical protein [Desulfuromonadales bacterium]